MEVCPHYRGVSLLLKLYIAYIHSMWPITYRGVSHYIQRCVPLHTELCPITYRVVSHYKIIFTSVSYYKVVSALPQ